MLLVSTQLANTLKDDQSVNFGLYFNKMLIYHDNFLCRDIERKRGDENQKGIIESLKPCEGEKDGKRFRDDSGYGPVRQHLPFYRKSCQAGNNVLRKRHIQQAGYCRAMEKAGWHSFIVHARLDSPFVSGLGMAHPTETGLVLDHNSGLPYIPAASQKGVLRLAHIINSLKDEKGHWLSEEELEERDYIYRKAGELVWDEVYDDDSKTIFGYSDKDNGLAGQMVVLDAYPLSPPELKEDILNPHFKEYYSGGEKGRGPTEDQQPVPIKFLTVGPGAEFVFRVLLRRPFLSMGSVEVQKRLKTIIEKNIHSALTEEGLGAKTSIGFGRFKILSMGAEPEKVTTWQKKEEDRKFPWKAFVRKIEGVQDWNQFGQVVLDSKEMEPEWQARLDVAKAVRDKAFLIKSTKPKKWTTERDKKVAAWLTPSGLDWEVQTEGSAVYENSEISEHDKKTLAEIQRFNVWGEYKNSSLKIEHLPLSCAKELEKKFKDMGCDNKKAKSDKKGAWKRLRKRIKELNNLDKG